MPSPTLSLRPPRRCSGGSGEDRAVTAVLSALFLAAVTVATLTAVQLYHVPQWQRGEEAARVAVVERQVAELKARLDGQVSSGDKGVVDNPFATSSGSGKSFPVAAPSTMAYGVAFARDTHWFNVSGSKLIVNLPRPPARDLVGLEETWVTGKTGPFTRLDGLRLRMPEVRGQDVGSWAELRLEGTDPGDVRGTLNFSVSGTSSDLELRVKVTCRVAPCNGVVVYDQAVAFHASTLPVRNWTVDALHPDYRFGRIAAAAAEPDGTRDFFVNLTKSGFAPTAQPQYSVTGSLAGAGSPEGLPPGRYLVEDTEHNRRNFTGGGLTLRVDRLGMASQEYVIEHGAVILRQVEDSIFLQTPGFVAWTQGETGAPTTRLGITLPTLRGQPFGFSPTGGVNIVTAVTDHQYVDFQGPQLRFRFGTEFPKLWADYLAATLDAGGVPPGGYVLDIQGNAVDLLVTGASASPDVFDVHLTLRQADIQVRV